MLYTILQIIAFQALFLLVYDLFLKRETFFNCNRAYLLVTSVISLVLPFIKFPKLKTIATNDLVIQLPEVFIGNKTPTEYDILVAEQARIIIEQPSVPIWQIVLFSGIAIATLFFMFKIVKLYVIKHKNPKRWQGNVLIVNLIKSSAAFSFFNTIFMGERIPETEKTTIYKHELVHIKELHSLDLLYFELLRIAMWFNPLVYLYQNRIKELHEYIADSKAVKENGKAVYYQSLLNQVFDVNSVSFTNTFFKKSLIKKRIAMLQKSKSKQLNLAKYILLLPMVFAMLIYTSTEVKAQEKEEVKQEVSQELTDEQLQEKYFKKLVELEKNGATFFELANYVGLNEQSVKQYALNNTQFLKFRAYLKFISKENIRKKYEMNRSKLEEIDFSESKKLKQFRNYSEYENWKQTNEAKELWETNSNMGELRMYVEDAQNFSIIDEERRKQYTKQLNEDDSIRYLIISDNETTAVLDLPKKSNVGTGYKMVEVKSIEVPFSVIDEVPTTQECQNLTTNEERKLCLSNFISKHVNRNFNIGLADSLNLNGRQRIFVSFKINPEGHIVDVGARGPHPDLEVEVKRVIATLPHFIPGKQKGEVVTVPYSLPIVFQINNGNKEQQEKQKIDDLEVIQFSKVDVAPAYEDCELITDNEARKECTSTSINKLVNKNFNKDIASEIGAIGRQRIFVYFIIDKQGNITNVKSRADYPEFEKEAIRVINAMPKFVPGRHDGKLVDVPYSLPIIFHVAEPTKD